MRYSEVDRKRRGKRKKKNYFRDITITVLAILGAYWIVFHSGIFDIKEITVENNVHYTGAQVAELTGVAMGENIFRVRVSSLAKTLEQDPYIREAVVSRVFPSGLNIVIDERKESVLVEDKDGYAIIDFDGIILRQTKERLILPVLSGLTPIDATPGTPLNAEEAGQLKPALDFIRYVVEHDFYIKKLNIGGVIPRAHVFDLLVLEGELRYIERNLEEIKRIISDLESQGIERGTISVSSSSCSFSPEIRN